MRLPARSFLFLCLLFVSCLSGRASSFDPQHLPEGIFSTEWSEVFVNGDKVGWSMNEMARNGDVIKIVNRGKILMGRGITAVEVTTNLESRESLDGLPVSAVMEYRLGAFPVITHVVIEGNTASLNSTHMGNESASEFPLPQGTVMAWGAHLQMQEVLQGEWETAVINLLAPTMTVSGAIEMELTNSGSKMYEGQEVNVIDYQAYIGGSRVSGVYYIEADTLKVLKDVTRMGGMEIEMRASSQEKALADFLPPDLLGLSLIDVSGRYNDDEDEVVWRITKPPASETLEIPDTSVQSVRRVSENIYEVTVRRGDWLDRVPDEASVANSEVPAAYTEPNLFINYDDEAVLELAKHFAVEKDNPFVLAREITDFVEGYIVDKSLAVGFASAAEVARTPAGDCTEHAVLLAALARANGMPARVATGLVFVEEFEGRSNVMGFHMWTQLHINGEWVDVDAAFGEVECSPRRITLATSDLKDTSMADLSFSVMDLMGAITIEVAGE